MRRAGIVDQNVERAEGRERLLDRCRDVGFLADVATQRDGVVADRARHAFRRIDIDIDHGDARAFAHISLGDAFADARSGAGD